MLSREDYVPLAALERAVLQPPVALAETGPTELPTVPRPPSRSGPGRAVGVVAVALVTASLLNSRALVRTGEGMHPGVTRDVTLAVARPLDHVASSLGLTSVRTSIDKALGRQSKVATNGGGLVQAAALPPPPPVYGPAAPLLPPLRTPTAADPLNVLVTGDSLSDYVGGQLGNLAADHGHLLTIANVPRNGTGLTTPGAFDWKVDADQEIAARHPEVVVVVLGGNDGYNLDYDGQVYPPNSDGWQAAYQARVAVVMRAFTASGARVFWSAPPTARPELLNAIYARQNAAAAAAAATVPGVTYVNLYGTAPYSDTATIDGAQVDARQADGIHWTYDGARGPAEQVDAAISTAMQAPAPGRPGATAP